MPKGKTSYKECDICNKQISLFAFNRHRSSHNLESFHETNYCRYCNKECKDSKSSVKNHEARCANNPNRKIQKLTETGRQRIKERSKNGELKWSEERKRIHSEIMKKVVELYPESYTSSNRGRTKQIIYDGIKFQGAWELEFYQYCKNHNIKIERLTEWFEYEWNGIRKYFPDFYLPEHDLYVEVKGYETDRDRAKWASFPCKLKIIRKDDIDAIRRDKFIELLV